MGHRAEPQWLRLDVVLSAHEEQIVEHGGMSGVRDMAALESALARPRQLFTYEDAASQGIPRLAAAHAWAVARNHPFSDGNKRMALLCAELFLNMNGWELTAEDADCVLVMLELAAGRLEEVELAKWFRAHAVKARPPA